MNRFGFYSLEHCRCVSKALDFGLLPLFSSLLGHESGGGDRRQSRGNRRSRQGRIARRVAIKPLVFNRRNLFFFFDAGGVVLAAEGALGIVALFLGRGDLTVKTDKEVNKRGKVVEVSFRVFRSGEFLEENLRETGGGGLEANFGKLWRIVATQEIQHVILVEAILEDV